MNVESRKYNAADYDRAIDFFRRLYRASDVVPFWLPARFEYAEYLVSPLYKHRGYAVDWKETIYLWETGGEVVAVLCSEAPDANIFLHAIPEFKHLQEEMLVVAEERIVGGTLGLSAINVWCRRGEPYLEPLLEKRGYRRQDEVEYLNWRDLQGPVSEIKMPEGLALHDMVSEDGLDLQHKIDRGTGAFDSATYPVWIYRRMQTGPSYRKDLDLYTTDTEGRVISFCTIWYDRELNVGYFEPVGTDASARRKGVGRATLNAGLRRLKEAGADKAYVGSSGDNRRAFYNASGFPHSVAFHPWRRELK